MIISPDTTHALFTLLFLSAAVVCALMIVTAWKVRTSPGAAAFISLMVAVEIWIIGTVLEYLAPSIDSKKLFLGVQYLGVGFVPPLWLLFTLEYTMTWRTESWRDWRLWVLFAPAVLTVLAAWSNPLHELLWQDLSLNQTSLSLEGTHGLLFWAILIYAYVCFFLGVLVVLRSYSTAPEYFRRRLRIILYTAAIVVLGNVLYVIGFVPVDVTALCFGIGGLLFLRTMLYSPMFDVLPIARRLVIRTMKEGVIVLDKESAIAEINPAASALLGLDDGPHLGQQLDATFAGRSAFLSAARANAAQITFQTDSGRLLELRRTPIVSPNREPAGTMMIVRDETAHTLAQQQALELALEQERLRVLSHFIPGAAHEFRTPLSIIKASLYVAERVQDPSQRAVQISKIETQVKRMNRLLDQVQTMVRLDAGMALQREPVDINGLVRAEADRQAGALQERHQSLTLELAPDLPAVTGDHTYLGRVFEELISNASTYTPADGAITVRTAVAGTGLLVSVSDTGSGMSPAVQERAFERLYRGDPSRSLPGFGLGLPIARHIVEDHGGRIEVISAPGDGSTFTVWLPLASPLPHETLAPDRNAAQPALSA